MSENKKITENTTEIPTEAITENSTDERNYKAFISYRHKPLDLEIAKKLHRRIERYTIPKDLRKDGASKLGLVFRDQDELPISDNLTRNIEVALDHSEFLIVVCSKDTPESLWVQREITYFLEHHDRNHLLAILISGESSQSFPKPLTEIRDADGNLIEEIEPLAANIVADSDYERNRLFKTESLRILASLIGCPYDALYHREQRYKMRRLAIASAAVISVAAIFIGMLINRNAKIREQLNVSMINESKALAALSDSSYEEGNYRQSLEYALDALPGRNPDRPYVAKAEAALSDKLVLYRSTNTMFYTQSFEQDTDIQALEISKDGSMIATSDNIGNVKVYDAKTGQFLWDAYAGNTTPTLKYVDDLLLVSTAFGNTAYTSTGEPVWTAEDELMLDVSDQSKLFLCHAYSGDKNYVKNAQTGTVVCDLGSLGSDYYLPLLGTISQDGKYAAILMLHEDSVSADLYQFDVATGEHKLLEKDLLNAYVVSNYGLSFDRDGNLAMLFTGDLDILKEYDYHGGSYMKIYMREDDWACKHTVELDFGTASKYEFGNIDTSNYIDCMVVCEEGIATSSLNRMIMVNSKDGTISWQRDLAARVISARYYENTNLMGVIQKNGMATMVTLNNGSFASDSGLAYLDCEYDVYGGALSAISDNKAQFVIVPARKHNLASIVTFDADPDAENKFITPSWGERIPVKTRLFVTSPSKTLSASVYIDGEDVGDYLLFDPADEKSPVSLTSTDLPSYELSDIQSEIMLTDTGKMILCGRVFDFESGAMTGLSRSGEYPDYYVDGRYASCQTTSTSSTSGVAAPKNTSTASSTSGVAEPGGAASSSEVLTACLEKNEDDTLDLVIWKNAEYTGQSSRVPLNYDELDEVLFYSYYCRAVAPTGYAVVCVEKDQYNILNNLLYNINEDEWTEMTYFDMDWENVFALADNHPWLALQKGGGELCLIDLTSGEQIRAMESTLTSASVSKIVFAMDDQRLLVFTNSGSLVVFDTGTGKELSKSNFAGSNIRFQGIAKYEVHSIPEDNKLLIIYDDTRYTEAIAITLNTVSMERTGLFSALSAYYPATNTVLIKEHMVEPCMSRLYTLEETEQMAEEILGGGTDTPEVPTPQR